MFPVIFALIVFLVKVAVVILAVIFLIKGIKYLNKKNAEKE